MSQSKKHVGHFANEGDRLLDRVHQNRKRFCFRTAFGLEHSFNRRKIEWIDGEAIESVGGNTHNFAAFDEAGSVLHHARFWGLGRYFKNFDGQCSLAALRHDALGSYHRDGRAGKPSTRCEARGIRFCEEFRKYPTFGICSRFTQAQAFVTLVTWLDSFLLIRNRVVRKSLSPTFRENVSMPVSCQRKQIASQAATTNG